MSILRTRVTATYHYTIADETPLHSAQGKPFVPVLAVARTTDSRITEIVVTGPSENGDGEVIDLSISTFEAFYGPMPDFIIAIIDELEPDDDTPRLVP